MRKTINSVLILAGMFTKNYVLLLIYNLFITTNFNLPTLTYWSMFFIAFFTGLISSKDVYKRLFEESEREKDLNYLEHKTLILVSQLLVFWGTIGILLLTF